MIITFRDKENKTYSFEITVIKNNTFIESKQEEYFKNFLNNQQNYKIEYIADGRGQNDKNINR